MQKLAVIFLFVSHVLAFICPNGSSTIPNENVCILPIPEHREYDLQIARCQLVYGIPVKIQNVFESAYVQSLIGTALNNKATYIGVTRTKTNRTWTYVDGSPLLYQNWDDWEPKTSNSDLCAHIDAPSGKWQAGNCDKKHATVCSIDRDFSSKCANGWTYFEKTDSCYYLKDFSNTPWLMYSWSDAENACVEMKAHLASIHSKEENLFIYALIESNVSSLKKAADNPCEQEDAWIGYYGNGKMGNGKWSDGTPMDYFAGYHPSNGSSAYWALYYDHGCYGARTRETGWDYTDSFSFQFPRYVCKVAAKG